jgi:predicted lipid-binding transport protein (Tim44 family)
MWHSATWHFSASGAEWITSDEVSFDWLYQGKGRGSHSSASMGGPAPTCKKGKNAARAAAAAASAAAAVAAAAAAAAASEAQCSNDTVDAAQQMLVAVVEGHSQRLEDTIQLFVQSSHASAREV